MNEIAEACLRRARRTFVAIVLYAVSALAFISVLLSIHWHWR